MLHWGRRRLACQYCATNVPAPEFEKMLLLFNAGQYLFQLIMTSAFKRQWLSLQHLLLKQARRLRPLCRDNHFYARYNNHFSRNNQ